MADTSYSEDDCQPDRTLRALGNRKSERVLLDVATWLEMRVDSSYSPALCRLIAMHYELLAGHRDVVSRSEMVAQYRRRASHWRMRAAAYGRCTGGVTTPAGLPLKPKQRIPQEDLI